MSVLSLCTTRVNIYSVITSQDQYGANYEVYQLKHSNVPIRVKQQKINNETFIDSKEMNISQYRLYFPYQIPDLKASDLVMDVQRKRKYDILYVNRMNRRSHMQVDTKMVNSIFDTCPNVIIGWNSSIIGVR